MIEVYSKQNFTGKAALKHNGDMVLTPYSCTVSIELGGAIVEVHCRRKCVGGGHTMGGTPGVQNMASRYF